MVSVNITIPDNPIRIEFSDAGSVLGSQLGYRLAGSDRLAGAVASPLLETLGDSLGDVFDGPALQFGRKS